VSECSPSSRLAVLAGVALLLCCPGCGKARAKPQPVTGQVLVDGRPAARAIVTFHPVGETGPEAVRPTELRHDADLGGAGQPPGDEELAAALGQGPGAEGALRVRPEGDPAGKLPGVGGAVATPEDRLPFCPKVGQDGSPSRGQHDGEPPPHKFALPGSAPAGIGGPSPSQIEGKGWRGPRCRAGEVS
jgi:hypothetical protein